MNSREEWNSILSGCAICCWIFAQEMLQFAHSHSGLFCRFWGSMGSQIFQTNPGWSHLSFPNPTKNAWNLLPFGGFLSHGYPLASFKSWMTMTLPWLKKCLRPAQQHLLLLLTASLLALPASFGRFRGRASPAGAGKPVICTIPKSSPFIGAKKKDPQMLRLWHWVSHTDTIPYMSVGSYVQ